MCVGRIWLMTDPKIMGAIPACAGGGPLRRAWPRMAARSIPACAGEPGLARTAARRQRAIPACAGGHYEEHGRAWPHGLSPPVRGKRDREHAGIGRDGSIPACAGERKLVLNPGLVVGSIPACAGETGLRRRACADRRVYPRLCGGNPRRGLSRRSVEGLSPPVRGKPQMSSWVMGYPRSIPACAGETARGSQKFRTARVYPRLCGGNKHIPSRNQVNQGLSPPVRGKHTCIC